MNAPLFLALGILSALSAAPAASPTIPQRPARETFDKLTEDWPFALATPVVPVAEPVKNWAENYFVSGIGKNYESGKEEFFAGIKKKDGTGSFSLYGSQPNADEGVSIGGIEWSDELGKGKVTLKKGGEFATIKFDEMALRTNTSPVPGAPLPGMLRNTVGVNKAPLIRPPGAAVPRPLNMPQPSAPVPLPTSSNTNAVPNTPALPGNPSFPNPVNAPRQRVRIINSTP